MGQAAGTAAALTAAPNVAARELAVPLLRTKLQEQGAIIAL